jgi:Flp pilus assembly protein TadG
VKGWTFFRKRSLAKIRALARSQSGVAAVEFAMLAPVLLLLYLGSVDLSQGLDADRKLAYVTHTIGDLASQTSGDVSADDLEGLLGIADTVLRPFDTSLVSVRITVADIAENGTYTLYVPVTRAGSSSGCSGEIALPQAMIDLARGRSLIATEGCYTYTPVVGYAIESDIPLYKRSFNVPRADSFNYIGDAAGSGQENCAGNSGGHGQGNNCNNPNQSHSGNGNSGNGNGGGNENSGANGGGNGGSSGGGWWCAILPFLC